MQRALQPLQIGANTCADVAGSQLLLRRENRDGVKHERCADLVKDGSHSYRLNLLGGFELLSPPGDEIGIVSRKGKILLAYLAMQNDQSATREHLIQLLWDNVEPIRARASLRQTLARLRKAIAGTYPDLLTTTAGKIAFHHDHVVVDARCFGEAVSQSNVDDLKDIIKDYRGEFLAGFTVESSAAEAWIESCRRQVYQAACEGHWRLASHAHATHQWSEAVEYAHRLLALDSLREDAHRVLIEAFAEQGKTGVALRQFHRCADLLRRQLGVTPELKTMSLYNSVKARRQQRSGQASRLLDSQRNRWSIAVLPFNSVDGDPTLQLIADGIAEDITTEFSRHPGGFVVAPNNHFAHGRGSDYDRHVAKDLGTQFVLGGHLRRTIGKVRLTVRLAATASSNYLWAERFDLAAENLDFAHDDITARVVSAVGDAVNANHLNQLRRKDVSSLDSYEKCCQASAMIVEPDRERFVEARRMAEEVITEEPRFAQAHAIHAWTGLVSFTSRWNNSPDYMLATSYEAAQKAVELDRENSFAYAALGICQTWQRHHDLAIASFQRGVALNPTNADTRAQFANVLVFAGQLDQALRQIEVAMYLRPICPATYPHFQGRAFFAQHRYEEAVHAFAQAVTLAPSWPWARLMLAAAQIASDNLDAGKSEVKAALKISPGLRVACVPETWPVCDNASLDSLIKLLRQAGGDVPFDVEKTVADVADY